VLAALLAAAAQSLSASAVQTAEAVCPLPAAEAAMMRDFVKLDPHDRPTAKSYEALAVRLSTLQAERRKAGAPTSELACLDGALGDLDMAMGVPGSAAVSYQQGVELFGGRIPPAQRTPPGDPEEDSDPSAVTVDLALKRAGGLAKLDDPVIDSLAERWIESWNAQGQSLEVDGLGQALLAHRRKRLGPDAPPALASLASVVTLERAVNRWDAALAVSSDQVARLTRLRGARAPDTLSAQLTHATILIGAGREVEAGRTARRVQADATAALGANAPIVFQARLIAVDADVAQARPPSLAELELLARETRTTLGADNPLALDAESQAIAALLRDRRYADAETRAKAHYVRLAQARGQRDLSWKLMYGVYAEAMLRQGRYVDAAPIYGEVSRQLGGVLTDKHPLPLAASVGWGRALLAPTAPARDAEQAERIFDEAQSGYEALSLDSQRDEARGWRGRARLQLDKPDTAYNDLTQAAAAVWRRQGDRTRIASTEAAGDVLRENRPLFLLSVQAGWRWAHQP
jgi:hypothetical protein